MNFRSRQYAANVVICCIFLCGRGDIACAQSGHAGVLNAAEKKALVDSFELIWSTLRDRYWDPSMAGLNWQATHDQYLRKILAASRPEDAKHLMSEMIERLPSSHLAVIPQWAYQAYPRGGSHSGSKSAANSEEDDNEAAGEGSTGLTVTVIDRAVVVEAVEKDSAGMEAGVRTGWKIESVDGKPTKELFSSIRMAHADAKASLITEIVQHWLTGAVGSKVQVSFTEGDGTLVSHSMTRRVAPGKLVEFGNLPPEHVSLKHEKLANGAGYLRLNLFLDPVSVMPEMESAIREFKDAPAVIFDLRNNPGGLGVMAMGLAGWFTSREGLELGRMTGRDLYMKFEINPRLEAYDGRLAILVNGGSASTTEILAQGLQDLGRARIFGTRTAGAALPSEIIELPDGDRFQYPEANYVSVKGRVLEGNGVLPDVVVRPTVAALLEGRDLVLEAAAAWSIGK